MRVIGIVGEPGSGKTTIVQQYLKKFGDARVEQLAPGKHGALYGMNLGKHLTLWGKYGKEVGIFQGTDALSTAVIPVAEHWMHERQGTVLFEGSRFTSGNFFANTLQGGHQLVLVRLRPPPRVCSRRRESRAEAAGRPLQSASFVKGQQTRIANALAVATDGGAQVKTFESAADCLAFLQETL